MALANITNNILTDTGVNVSSLTPTSTTISTTAPLQGGGDLSANRTLSITQSGTSANGFLSSTDWNTFNNKQAAGNYMTSLTGEATGTGPGATAVILNNASVTAKVLTGVNITGGSISASDSILTAFGKVQNQINGLIGSSIYQGVWNAATNTPTLQSGVGVRGYYYIVNVAGTTNLDGITDWFVGDWAIFDGTAWQQVDNTDAVVSVNGQTGAVSLTTDNIPEGATNQYFLNSRARAALSFAAGSGAYNSTTGVITIPTNTSQLTNGANFITLASLSGTAPIQYNSSTGAISITQSGTSSNGFLSSTDWNTFNNKQSALTNPVTGTGTTNYLPKFTGTSTIGNSSLQDDGSNVFLSNGYYISTRTDNTSVLRTHLLMQRGSGAGTYADIFTAGDTANGVASMQFGFNSSAKMILTASGNLGLGVTPSAWGSGSTAFEIGNGAIWKSGSRSVDWIANGYYDGTNYIYNLTNAATFYRQYDGQHQWHQAPSGTAGNAISFTQAMTLDASGNLLLGGTSTNSGRLQVTGTANNWTQTILASTTSGQSYGLLVTAGTTSTDASFYVRNAAGTSPYLYIRGDGNVGIGTTSPTAKLEVVGGTINNQIARFITADFPTHSIGLGVDGAGSEWGASIFQDDVKRFTIDGNGGILVGSSYQSSNAPANGAIIQGNVGIGTSSPGTKLQVNSTAGTYGITNTNGTVTIGTYIEASNTYASFGTSSNHPIGFFTNNNAPQMYINTSGNVGIGTTSPNNNTISAFDALTIGKTSTSSSALVFTNGSSTIWGFNYANEQQLLRVH